MSILFIGQIQNTSLSKEGVESDGIPAAAFPLVADRLRLPAPTAALVGAAREHAVGDRGGLRGAQQAVLAEEGVEVVAASGLGVEGSEDHLDLVQAGPTLAGVLDGAAAEEALGHGHHIGGLLGYLSRIHSLRNAS